MASGTARTGLGGSIKPASFRKDGVPGTEVRGRRAGVDDRLIKDQLKKQLAAPDGDNAIVSDSDDDDDDDDDDGGGGDDALAERDASFSGQEGEATTSGAAAPDDVFEEIMRTLQSNFVFTGICTAVLTRVVHRMRRVEFGPGDVIVQQGDQAGPSDCLYFVESGSVDVVISGGGAGRDDDEVDASSTRGKTVIRKHAGWHFGVLTLLFSTPRSASVLAHGDAVLWSLDRGTFLRFVLTHAHGARAVRFLRKLPLLNGLTDDKLVDIASRVREEVYEAGDYLINAGDRAVGLFVIRYGTVVVKIGDKQLSTLGRGKFVGERTLVTGKLRSASCVAQTRVTAIVMQKREFLEVDNPMLDWMIPYDAARAVLTHRPEMRALTSDQFELLLDRFGSKTEVPQGRVLVEAGAMIDQLHVIITGTVELRNADGAVVAATKKEGLFQEDGGFSSYGLCSLADRRASPYSVVVSSKTLTYVTLDRESVDDLLGVRANQDAKLTRTAREFAKGVLQQSLVLSKLNAAQLDAIVLRMTMMQCTAGQIIVQMGDKARQVVVLQHGECIAAKRAVDDATTVQDLRAVGHTFMMRGDIYGEMMLVKGRHNPASIVAVRDNTVGLVLTLPGLLDALGYKDEAGAAAALAALSEAAGAAAPHTRTTKVPFTELKFHRVVGRGQFGAVRMATHAATGQTFALKTLYKAPISDAKQVEHIINELSVMQAVRTPFCVQLRGSYQDQNCLYMLMDWVPGGELFHYIDVHHSFDEATARFFAANVVLTLEHLHAKGIVYRDLKPENLVLEASGYLKLADFGFAKHIGSSKAFTICGTPDYQAPEVIMRRGATRCVDFWAIGVLIYEMLVGEPPFMSKSGDPWDTFRRAMTGRCHVPRHVSKAAADLIYKLLQVNPEQRLGLNGVHEIKQHAWFASLDWAALEARKLKAPIIPKLDSIHDMSNFANYDAEMTPPPANTRKDGNLWQMWQWVDTSRMRIHEVTADDE